eukprot:1461692-Amphidinium_carterae.1
MQNAPPPRTINPHSDVRSKNARKQLWIEQNSKSLGAFDLDNCHTAQWSEIQMGLALVQEHVDVTNTSANMHCSEVQWVMHRKVTLSGSQQSSGSLMVPASHQASGNEGRHGLEFAAELTSALAADKQWTGRGPHCV